MFCKNCGKEVNDKAIACPSCGVAPKTEKRFCNNCGISVQSNQIACVKCGVGLESISGSEKSKIVAGILGVIPPTTALGIHRFYLGYMGLGILHVCLFFVGLILSLTIIGAIIGGPMLLGNLIWGVIEGIMIFAGAISKDASGKSLKD